MLGFPVTKKTSYSSKMVDKPPLPFLFQLQKETQASQVTVVLWCHHTYQWLILHNLSPKDWSLRILLACARFQGLVEGVAEVHSPVKPPELFKMLHAYNILYVSTHSGTGNNSTRLNRAKKWRNTWETSYKIFTKFRVQVEQLESDKELLSRLNWLGNLYGGL